MEKDTMEIIHDSDFALLCEVDRLCRVHHIHYFLHGGTLLGAIRHQDFIPWDDDVDIAFLRGDYERFLEVFRREADPRFRLIEYDQYPEFYDFFVKIADTSITYQTAYGEEAFYGGRYSHPTMDLAVIDYEASHRKLQLFLIKALYALAMGHRPYIDYSKHHGLAAAAARILPSLGALIPFRVTERWYRRVQLWGRGGNHLFVSNDIPPYWGFRYTVDMYSPGHTAPIRGKEFPIPADPDAWLRQSYGDYMQLPPEEQRQPQHLNIVLEGPHAENPAEIPSSPI